MSVVKPARLGTVWSTVWCWQLESWLWSISLMVLYHAIEHVVWNPDSGMFHEACQVTHIPERCSSRPSISKIKILCRISGGWGLGKLFYDYRGFGIFIEKNHARCRNQNKSMGFFDIINGRIMTCDATHSYRRAKDRTHTRWVVTATYVI